MKYLFAFLFCFTNIVFAQKNYSDQWQDLYSYNNVKDFTIVGNKLYAISNNAMFTYDIETNETHKFSSINGLSGTNTSSISYDEFSHSIIIGYENGLIEVVSADDSVVPITGIKDNLILVDKIVNGVYSNQNQSYVYGNFGIVELDVEAFEYGDTYKLSDTSSSYSVNQIIIENNILYAATNNGLYQIDLSLNPIDFNNWIQVSTGNISNLLSLDGEVYFTKGSGVYEISNPSIKVITATASILNLEMIVSKGELVLTMSNSVDIYETSTFTKTDQVNFSSATNYSFITTKAIIRNNEVFVNTTNFGVLKTLLTDKVNYTELHPDGPTANDVFTITVKENQKWIVYGGHDKGSYSELKYFRNIDYFDGVKWGTIKNSTIGGTNDYTKAIIDPKNPDRVLIASYSKGIVELNNNAFRIRWNDVNTGGIIPYNRGGSSLINWESDLIVDKNNNIWSANARALNNQLFSMYDGDADGGQGMWTTTVFFPPFKYNKGNNNGLNKMFVDHNNNIFAGTRFMGLIAFNANPVDNEDDRELTVIDNTINNGELPSNEVYSVVADENDRIWIGTDLGLVVFDDYDNLFKNTKRPASKLIIEENGVARALLADTPVNDIIIDLAGNKWFATEGAGVIQTSSDGQTTYNIFNTSNSPLPSNSVIDLELDESTGEIYIVTEKGTLAYDSKNEPFGTSITSVIAYPNPAVRNQAGHENITIVAKDGNGIPDGTNVKIMDVSGRLVYETNVNQSNQSFGGKVVWDKTNLRGNPVVSGVYIVLLSSPNGSETTTAKIAIVN